MQEYMQKIETIPLFQGIKTEQLSAMLNCLGSFTRTYKKGELLSLSHEKVKNIGLVLSGTVHMIKEDVWGDKTILAIMKEGELFGETFVCGSMPESTVTFQAAENSKILYLSFHKVLHSCTNACMFHHRLIENMVKLIADKNGQLLEKVEVVSKKTLRNKILSYLSMQSQHHGSNYFEIPLGRVELAQYLCVDRSALTRELSTMREDGLIDFDKNTFRIL